MGYTALDIAVLRGSQQMCQKILASEFLEVDTISIALGRLEEKRDLGETNGLLKKICNLIKVVEDKHISFENKNAIKEILNKKLQELAPEILLKKELKESIAQRIDGSEFQEDKDKIKKHLLEISGDNSTFRKICEEVFEEKFNEKLAIENQDSNFAVDYNQVNRIIKFYTIAPDNKDAKFDYNKMLIDSENYESTNYTKEKEQEKILAMLTKAKDATLKRFPNSNLDDNFLLR